MNTFERAEAQDNIKALVACVQDVLRCIEDCAHDGDFDDAADHTEILMETVRDLVDELNER